MTRIILVTGGARSGKSRYAEGRVEGFMGDPVYIASGQARDEEMRARIAEHQARRGNEWQTVEAPINLVGALEETDIGGPRLVDCLTLWLSNLIEAGRDLEVETDALIGVLYDQRAPVVLVTNEVGLGIVPENALARSFRDAAGRLNQRIGEIADEVVLVVAGQPLKVKGAR